MTKTSKRFWEDMKWGMAHHTELLEKYKDKWVAIFKKKVVASGTNLKKVEEQATKKTGLMKVPVILVECGAHIYGIKN